MSTQAIPQIAMTIEEVRVALSCGTKRSAQRALVDLGVKPYRRGKYRIKDIENAVARKSMQAKAAEDRRK